MFSSAAFLLKIPSPRHKKPAGRILDQGTVLQKCSACPPCRRVLEKWAAKWQMFEIDVLQSKCKMMQLRQEINLSHMH